jgi:hypothetical protein
MGTATGSFGAVRYYEHTDELVRAAERVKPVPSVSSPRGAAFLIVVCALARPGFGP